MQRRYHYHVSESVHGILLPLRDLAGNNIWNLVHPDDTVDEEFFVGRPGQARVTLFNCASGMVMVTGAHRAIGNNLLDEPSVGGIVLNFDISERKRAAERLRHNAFHDPPHRPTKPDHLWTD